MGSLIQCLCAAQCAGLRYNCGVLESWNRDRSLSKTIHGWNTYHTKTELMSLQSFTDGCMDVLKLSKPEIRKRKINGTTSCCRDCHTSRVLWVVPPIVLGLCCCGGLCCGGLCCGRRARGFGATCRRLVVAACAALQGDLALLS